MPASDEIGRSAFDGTESVFGRDRPPKVVTKIFVVSSAIIVKFVRLSDRVVMRSEVMSDDEV